MRITQNMMSSIFIRSMQKQAEGLLQRQEQLATQKRINRPSDDPIGIGRVLNGRSMLATIDQYTENIRQGKARLEMTDQTLAMVGDLVKQARRIAEEKSGAEISASEREFAAGQVKEIYDQILQLANTTHGGRYMFSGDLTDTAPFTRDDQYTASYNGNKRSEFGPKLYRFQATEEHWTAFKTRIQDAVGRDEDVDVVQVALELNNLKTAYETSMAAAAKILQPSLVNFLR